MRVGYNYLGEQTIPRVGLSPTRNTALWAAHVWLSRHAQSDEGAAGVVGLQPFVTHYGLHIAVKLCY